MKRVLLIERETPSHEAISCLFGHGGLVVYAYTSAAEASSQLIDGGFDVVVVDAQLPDGSGLDIAEAVSRKWPAKGVVVMTSKDAVGAEARRRCPGVSVLMKPLSGERLIEALGLGMPELLLQLT